MTTMYESEKNIGSVDGWGDENENENATGWENFNEYDNFEDEDAEDVQEISKPIAMKGKPTVKIDIREIELDQDIESDITAAENELEEACRKGDQDAIDRCADELIRLKDAAEAAAGIPKPQKRRSRTPGWTPPPQCSQVIPSKQGVFKPKSPSWLLPKRNESPVHVEGFPNLEDCKKKPRKRFQKVDEDLLRLHKLRSSECKSPRLKSGKIKMKTNRVLKMGSMGRSEQKHREYKSRHEKGEETDYERRGREANEARSKKFAAVSEAHDKPADERAKTLGWVRTKPCLSVIKGIPCPHGDKCRFAHTPEELQIKSCHFGDRCNKKDTCKFPHTAIEAAISLAKARALMRAQMEKLEKEGAAE